MSEAGKTLKPTPRRIQQFRERGQIAISRDVAAAATMAGGAIALVAGANEAMASLGQFMRASVTAVERGGDSQLVSQAVRCFVTVTTPVFVGGLIGYVAAAGGQLGWPPAIKKLSFDLGRPFTFQSIASIVSPKAIAGRVVRATAKVTVILIAMGIAIHSQYRQVLSSPAQDKQGIAVQLSRAIFQLGAYALFAIAALAAIDYALQRRKMGRVMLMTPEDIRREQKNQEGDPTIKGARRRKMRELAKRRVHVAVKQADVVVVNPTHYAVALAYSAERDRAPRVVAKGKDLVAERIRAIARRSGVPILRRAPLARLLYKLVPEGKEIPQLVYHAVAEVLAYVYRLRDRRGVA